MNKNQFYGWKQVCAFAYVQTMKSRVMSVTLAILCTVMLLSMPVISIFTGKGESETEIKKVYLYVNQEELETQLKNGLKLDGKYKTVELEYISSEKADEIEKNLAEQKETDYLLGRISYHMDMESEDYGLTFQVLYGKDSNVSSGDAEGFTDAYTEKWKEVLLAESVENQAVLEQLLEESSCEVFFIDKDGTVHTGEGSLDSLEYSVTYGYLMVALFAIMIAGSKTAELIVTEKTSKVMEYLLTSIRPMALLLGKIVATLGIVITFLAAIGVSLFASFEINVLLNGGSFIPKVVKDVITSGTFQGASVYTVLLGLGMLSAGLLFYGFLAGLAGATVSKVEELAEGLKMFSFALIVGCYLVLALMIMAQSGNGMGVFRDFVIYFPLSSVFVVPVYLLLGKISLGMGLLSFGIMLAALAVLWVFVTKVFEYVLYHNGSVMKFKEILEIYKKGSRKQKEVQNGK